jgi:hypothetical protein
MFRLLLLVGFIIETTPIGWASYICFLCDGACDFLACCVCLGGFFYPSLLCFWAGMPKAYPFVQIFSRMNVCFLTFYSFDNAHLNLHIERVAQYIYIKYYFFYRLNLICTVHGQETLLVQ